MPSTSVLEWTAAVLGAAGFFLAALHQVLRPFVDAWVKRPSWERRQHDRLLWLLVALGCSLAPVFFLDMFRTVTDLLDRADFPSAWTVPAATEGAFVFLYLLGLWLQRKGKPKAWLRWAPYPFAAASLFLNVYAAHGQIPAMVGHASVTVAFFLPVLAAESAVHSLAVTDEEMALRRELADAMRYARDLVRDRKGVWWRLRVPALLRRQIAHSHPPAAVVMALAEGAEGKGAAAWETPVEDWVRDGLTSRERVAEKVATEQARVRVTAQAERRAIEASAEPAPDASSGPQPGRQPARQRTAAKGSSGRAKAKRLLTATPDMPRAEVARRAGVSESTVDRVKRDLASGAEVIAIGGR